MNVLCVVVNMREPKAKGWLRVREGRKSLDLAQSPVCTCVSLHITVCVSV